MPAWTPGSYKVRDFARHVQDFSASDGRGRPLAAPTYDALVDAPVELGAFEEAHFRERSVPHRVVLCGQGADRQAVDLVPDVQKLVRAGAALFGGLPYKEYTFFVHVTSQWGGGLEHAQS